LAVLGIGVDAVDVERFRRVLERRPAIVGRLFTDAEREYATRSKDPSARYAVRFAAKEAVLKVFGTGIGPAAFAEIEVLRNVDGAPRLELHGDAARYAEKLGVKCWHLSLTHTAVTAFASVIAEGLRPVDGDAP